ncbi:hypothetical protein PAXRUDRAFT_831262 [Paxillus rubicundulus Ve08.2h10]|uniref:Uncharacterized protein n=1 Tax=Paxillus rubicundulus Ve08.2h10 TaxID=930991 RepID=A0A0D0DSA7_9AGAM|nr:hypothetical protein PAXRUDRAFT_831262 [Paxillus rubicundulus Ve08.2h10]
MHSATKQVIVARLTEVVRSHAVKVWILSFVASPRSERVLEVLNRLSQVFVKFVGRLIRKGISRDENDYTLFDGLRQSSSWTVQKLDIYLSSLYKPVANCNFLSRHSLGCRL